MKTRRDANDVEELVRGVLSGDRRVLAQAITLIESVASHHAAPARELLQLLLPKTGQSVRIGVTGVPGAGKSTFIDSFGYMLCEAGYHVAVLAVDPSSAVSGGSILGDKTRMFSLTQHANSYVRPTPAGHSLGGVSHKTREAILLCEASGYNVIIVETVGVGQNEAAVRSMVDFFLLLVLTGAGDDLQSIKRGVLELADAIVVNKADNSNKDVAERLKQQLISTHAMFAPATPGWVTLITTCSALQQQGLDVIWEKIHRFRELTCDTGVFDRRRGAQAGEWLDSIVNQRLRAILFQCQAVKTLWPKLQSEVIAGDRCPAAAADELFAVFKSSRQNSD